MERQADQPDPLKPSQDATNSEPAAESSKPAKITWPLRDVTGTRQSEDQQSPASTPQIEEPTGPSLHPEKAAWPPRNVTGIDEGRGIQIIGWDVPGRKPPPMPDESELREVAESKHRYPDLPQAPTRNQFEEDAAFNAAMSNWLVKVAPVVLRRNKFSKPRPKPDGG